MSGVGGQLAHRLGFRRVVVAFAVGCSVGGVFIPGIQYLYCGYVDPFRNGWPLYLQASSFLSSFMISLLLRCTFASAFGLYAGLIGLMLVAGQSEYPVASAIGLAVQGFLPAVFGAALACAILRVSRRRSLRSARACHCAHAKLWLALTAVLPGTLTVLSSFAATPLPTPHAEFRVACDGKGSHPGTADAPFTTRPVRHRLLNLLSTV